MNKPRILIAGIGNIFFGDDAFGCETIKRLRAEKFPANVKVVDFGIKTRDLAFEICANYDLIVLVDAVVRGAQAGTIYLIELQSHDFDNQQIAHAHDLKLRETFAFARELGARIDKILLVGCEPESFEREDLSAIVYAATDKAVELIKKIVAEQNENEHEYSNRER